MRFFISIDIEGIVGVTTPEHLHAKGFDYSPARRWMTESLKAAIAGAREAGVDEIVVADSHGCGINVLLDELPKGVELVRSWPRPLGMAQGVEHGEFVGAALIGYHAGESATEGGLAHTLHGRVIAGLKINGRAFSETALTAALCGHYGVPVVFFSGDDCAVSECKALLGEMDTVTSKHAYGFFANRSRVPATVYAEIQEGMRKAVEGRSARQPWTLEGPLTIDVQLKDRSHAELLTYLPGVSRGVSTNHVRIVAKDIVEANRWLMNIIFTQAAIL